ncbi:MAG: molybdopterin-dependent oxidoreductase [Candidatus Brocadiia bacterium]
MGKTRRELWGNLWRLMGPGIVIGVLIVLLGYEAVRRPARYTDPPKLHVTGPGAASRIGDADSYRLRVWGKVEQEQSLDLHRLHGMETVATDAPLACVVGWTDHALWRGVPIRDVVRLARPEPDATHVVFTDDKDFSSSLSLDYVRTGRPILAWEVNHRPLPRIHGWPLRVVAPGKWGYKWVKWVTSIEVTDRGHEGNYESMGFSLDGDAGEPKLEADKG